MDNTQPEQRPGIGHQLKAWFQQFFQILYEDLRALFLGEKVGKKEDNKAGGKPDEPSAGSCCKPK